jgi:phosphoglycolate phosphatase-like HAD superfamily hydrolase
MLELYGRETAVYIGDSDHDGLAASAAGCKFVLINTRPYDKETIASLRPDAVIENLSQLQMVLDSLN